MRPRPLRTSAVLLGGFALLTGLPLAGCAGPGQPAMVTEVGGSLGRLRDTIVTSAGRTGGRAHSLSPHMLFATLRKSLAALPDTLQLHVIAMPAPSDLGRLLEPPNSGWKPAGLGERIVSRIRF